jgi:putative hydrolase of the HAD superfamily
MDGTLLDLAFDNFFWLELVPREYARRRSMPEALAREEIQERYRAVIGSLPWYSIDYWTVELDLDIRELKRAHRHRIQFLPGAEAFLKAVIAAGKRLILVTNAHPVTLAIKTEVTGIDRWFSEQVSSHQYQAAKEERRFWSELVSRTGVDIDRALLIEDSVPVLQSAQAFGIKHLLAVRRPDSTAPPREIEGFPAVDAVSDVL